MSTFVRDIPTVTGQKPGEVFGAFQILGVSRRLTETGNQVKANNIYSERVILSVPVGTQMIIPSIDKWVLGYGEDTRDNPNELKWNQDQARFGMGNVAVRVLEVGQPDLKSDPPKQQASIGVYVYLSDQTAMKPWFGKIHYHLIHLGLLNAAVAKPADTAMVQTVDFD